MTFLVLLAGAAGAGIVGIDLAAFLDSTGLLLLLIQALAGLLVKNRLPLLKAVQPLGTCCHHVLEQLLFVKAERNLCVLFHFFDGVGGLEAVVDAVQETDHGHQIDPVFFRKSLHCTPDFLIGGLQKLFIDIFFFFKIISPKSLQVTPVGRLVIRFVTPLFQ